MESFINEFLPSAIISSLLIVGTTLLFYEVLGFTWRLLPKLQFAPRKRVLVVMLSMFFGHTCAVWLYGIMYWVLANYINFGKLSSTVDSGFSGTLLSYVYFSVVTYSSLGLGDVHPEGGFQLIAGIEVLNGLVLIGWSVSFTYLVMEKFWDLNRESQNKK
jgi:hypothetical protein